MPVDVTETTTIRVSRSTLKMLERVRQLMGASSMDEAIRLLIMQQRERVLERVVSVDRALSGQ